MIRPFTLHQPNSVEGVCSLLARYGEEAKILAGGSELILLLKFGLISTKHIIDVKGVAGLDHLELDHRAQVLRIGTVVTHRALETSKTVREYFPVLVEMERHLAI